MNTLTLTSRMLASTVSRRGSFSYQHSHDTERKNEKKSKSHDKLNHVDPKGEGQSFTIFIAVTISVWEFQFEQILMSEIIMKSFHNYRISSMLIIGIFPLFNISISLIVHCDALTLSQAYAMQCKLYSVYMVEFIFSISGGSGAF